MTENTTETRTVRRYRHAARSVLTQARERLSLRTDATREVYSLLNGSIESILQGRQGLSQEAQVEYLTNAIAQVEANRESLAEATEAAKQQVIEQVQSWDFDAAMDSALATLHEAKEFAASRDFDAHQEEKRRRGGYRFMEPVDEAPEADEDAEE